jgi:hypothetical protein
MLRAARAVAEPGQVAELVDHERAEREHCRCSHG